VIIKMSASGKESRHRSDWVPQKQIQALMKFLTYEILNVLLTSPHTSAAFCPLCQNLLRIWGFVMLCDISPYDWKYGGSGRCGVVLEAESLCKYRNSGKRLAQRVEHMRHGMGANCLFTVTSKIFC